MVSEINGNLSEMNSPKIFDASFSNGDIHIYKIGRTVFYRIHVEKIVLAAYQETQIYTITSDTWRPFVDVIKSPAVCDNPGDGDFYFTINTAGQVFIGTRNKVLVDGNGLHFYGLASMISKN